MTPPFEDYPLFGNPGDPAFSKEGQNAFQTLGFTMWAPNPLFMERGKGGPFHKGCPKNRQVWRTPSFAVKFPKRGGDPHIFMGRPPKKGLKQGQVRAPPKIPPKRHCPKPGTEK